MIMKLMPSRIVLIAKQKLDYQKEKQEQLLALVVREKFILQPSDEFNINTDLINN